MSANHKRPMIAFVVVAVFCAVLVVNATRSSAAYLLQHRGQLPTVVAASVLERGPKVAAAEPLSDPPVVESTTTSPGTTLEPKSSGGRAQAQRGPKSSEPTRQHGQPVQGGQHAHQVGSGPVGGQSAGQGGSATPDSPQGPVKAPSHDIDSTHAGHGLAAEDEGDGEHGDGEHGDGEHGDGEHADGEHGDGEHGDGEHGDGEHGDGEHGVSEDLEELSVTTAADGDPGEEWGDGDRARCTTSKGDKDRRAHAVPTRHPSRVRTHRPPNPFRWQPSWVCGTPDPARSAAPWWWTAGPRR